MKYFALDDETACALCISMQDVIIIAGNEWLPSRGELLLPYTDTAL